MTYLREHGGEFKMSQLGIEVKRPEGAHKMGKILKTYDSWFRRSGDKGASRAAQCVEKHKANRCRHPSGHRLRLPLGKLTVHARRDAPAWRWSPLARSEPRAVGDWLCWKLREFSRGSAKSKRSIVMTVSSLRPCVCCERDNVPAVGCTRPQ